MDNNILIIVIVVIAFLLLGCSCSCKGKTNENFGGLKKKLKKKINKGIRQKNWNNSLIINEFCNSSQQCINKTKMNLRNSLHKNITAVGKKIYHDLAKSAGGSMAEKNCQRKFKGNQYKKCVKNTQEKLKTVLIGPLTKAGMNILKSL